MSRSRLKSALSIVLLTSIIITCPVLSQASAPATHGGFLEILDEPKSAPTLTMQEEKANWRDGGFKSNNFLYVGGTQSPVTITGLNIPIRENPGEGEQRFFSFAWRRWGNGTVAIEFERDPSQDGENRQGALYDYRLDGGDGPPVGGKALRVSESLGGGWQDVSLDLWKTFGDFTITGIKLIVESRDAGFDAIAFARTEDGFSSAAPLVQPRVAAPVEVLENTGSGDTTIAVDSSADTTDKVKIDWAGQIKAGGIWMYPLYACALAALVIAIQRLLTIRESRLAPAALRRAIRQGVESGDFKGTLTACRENPSTLAEVTGFILEHRHAAIDVVNQTAGDIAARDIRGHLARIYPLSLISSISPLLGLLGTIIGMVEAFGIVALYGDEGGASILSDSISKALITTAAGLIIAIPCIAIYFTLKNRIMGLATVIEIEVEELVTKLYLREGR